jgi:hypothetical protein
MATDYTIPKEEYRALVAENERLQEQSERLFDKTLELATENALLRELVRDYHRFADAMCAERGCEGCSQRDDGACEHGVLTSRECVLGVDE